MRKSKFSETQHVAMLKDAESSVPVADLLRKHGVSQQGDVLQVAEQVRRGVGVGRQAAAGARGRERKAETDVRRPGAGERGHQGCPQPKAIRPSAKRPIAEVLVREHQLSIQRACRVVRLSRTVYYQPPQPASRRDAVVIAALTDAVARYPGGASGSSLIACGSKVGSGGLPAYRDTQHDGAPPAAPEPGMHQDRLIRRSRTLLETLEAAKLEDFIVLNDGRSVTDVARDVFQRASWIA